MNNIEKLKSALEKKEKDTSEERIIKLENAVKEILEMLKTRSF
ncbi:MAG: hypothetical protein WCW77_00105 [Patescibacteria group bacterium]|jgi:hypothetical protein